VNTTRKLAYCFLTLHVFLSLTACQNKTETTTFSSEGVTVELPAEWKFNGLEKDGVYAPKEFTWDIGEFSAFGIYVYDKRKMEHFDEATLEWFYHRFTRRSFSEFANGSNISETRNAFSIAGMEGIHAVIAIELFGEITTDITILQKETSNLRAFILFNTTSAVEPADNVDISDLIEPILATLSIAD